MPERFETMKKCPCGNWPDNFNFLMLIPLRNCLPKWHGIFHFGMIPTGWNSVTVPVKGKVLIFIVIKTHEVCGQ